MAPNQSSSHEDCINASVAVGIDRDKNSQFALRWAIEHLPLSNNTVILVHVRVKNYQGDHGSSHGSASSHESIQDQSEFDQTHQLFLPFRGFCARKGVIPREVILDEPDIARGIADFADVNFIHNIVLGASHRNALTRNFMRKPDVPSVLSKFAPDFCAVYVVSKLKATTIRAANRPVPYHGAPPKQQSSSVHGTPDDIDSDDSTNKTTFGRGPSRRNVQHILERRPPFVNTRTPPKERLRSTYNTNLNNISSPSDNQDRSIRTPIRTPIRCQSPTTHSPSPRTRTPSPRTARYFSDDDLSSRGGGSSRQFDSGFSNSGFSNSGFSNPGFSNPEFSNIDDDSLGMSNRDIELEMMRLKQELKKTMEMYSTACKEAISAKQKAKELQRWKSEECRRFEEARLAEEAALEIVKMEQAKCRAAVEAATMAQKLADMEAKKRMEAETKAQREAEEKKRVLSTLAKNDIRYRKYNMQEIEKATNNFSSLLKIGEGGYGPVYRAIMDHTPVAVKLLKADAVQGMQQFQQEVEVLSSIRHPNMVLLLGACPENGCLVYEYMDNGSLDDRLFRRGGTPTIPWHIRFSIAAEIATALLFLHQTKPEPLVHRDLKPGNILLDRNYTSKISDVGLARLVPPSVADTVTQYRMTSAAGTFCYIDPEYQQTGMLGIKSDVYSLGIMLLQIITAKPPMGLSHYVERSIEKGTFEQMLDPTVPNWPVKEALSYAKMALKCAELRRRDRPDLGTVVLPELNRLRDLGIRQSAAASLFAYTPWSYTANSRPVSSTTSQGTSKSCIMESPFEERIRSGPRSRSVTDADAFINRKMISVEDSW